MKIQKMLTMLNNTSLDITIDDKIFSTKYFKIELFKFRSLDLPFEDIEDTVYFWETFFQAREDDIRHIYNAMTTEYNALSNYDKTETYTTTSNNTVQTENTTTNLNDVIAETEKTTYNSDSLHTSDVVSTKLNDVKQNATGTNTNTTTYTNNTSGNIGVTTSQQMLKSEYEVRLIGIYELLTKMFINAFAY